MELQNKMKIEIWSDIACPFCYIGKHQLEKVLKEFPHSDEIEVIWKTFLLNPDIPSDSKMLLRDYFSEVKGMEPDRIEKILNYTQYQAQKAGLTFNYDKVIAANTSNAHRISHLAKTKSAALQSQAEELLFSAYFTEGKDINSAKVLMEIGEKLGFEPDKVKQVLAKKQFNDGIAQDIQEAIVLDIQVVPYFIFNKHTIISGVQEETKILQTLETAYQQWKNNNTPTNSTFMEGKSCSIDGHCE